LAGGEFTGNPKAGEIVLAVSARLGDADWGIIQSPFMRDNAKTVAFEYKATLAGDELEYFETTYLEIYGRKFEHTDTNRLRRNAS
jgi:hypothetical protein